MSYSRPPPPSGQPSISNVPGEQPIKPTPISSGNPPTYAFATKVFKSSLRPAVLLTTFAGFIWSLLWAIGNLQDISGDKSHNLGNFMVFDIVLGTLHMVVVAIEIFGFAGAIMQSLPFIRIYAPLSLVAFLVTTTAELMNLVLHFVFKNKLINECTQEATGETLNFDFGFFGGHSSETLSPSEAQNFCQNAWDHDTFTDFAWLFASTLLALFYASVAYGYYHQLLDPTSVISRLPRATNNYPMNNFRAYDNAPGQSNLGYAPPPGAPPSVKDGFVPPYDPAKLPAYGYGVDSEVPPKFDDMKDDDKEGSSGSHA